MHLHCFGQRIPLRSTELYTEAEIYEKCSRIRGMRRAVAFPFAQQHGAGGFNAALHFSSGDRLPVDPENLMFACAVMAKYHNVFAGGECHAGATYRENASPPSPPHTASSADCSSDSS